MDPETRAAYDEGRELGGQSVRAFCYAPFTSLYLNTHGDVLACCQNTQHVLGNLAEQRLGDIWHGRRTRELRAALVDYDLHHGCRFCAWQLDDANHEMVYARRYDLVGVQEDPEWPRRLELSLSNTCNLECVMCNGEWSSRIRSRREGRPPLPKAYHDEFFEDLEAFLPHLEEVMFLGGEPLLAAESLRVMEMLVEGGHRPRCYVTTNGTQWSPRLETLLARLPVSIAVSLDGVSRETVEAVRVGASYDELMTNLDRFRAVTDANGMDLNFTFCLMSRNWHEFADYLRFADEWDARVFVNTVIDPETSLYQLPEAEFAEVLDALEQHDAVAREQLEGNLDVWVTELDRLRSWRSASPERRSTCGASSRRRRSTSRTRARRPSPRRYGPHPVPRRPICRGSERRRRRVWRARIWRSCTATPRTSCWP